MNYFDNENNFGKTDFIVCIIIGIVLGICGAIASILISQVYIFIIFIVGVVSILGLILFSSLPIIRWVFIIGLGIGIVFILYLIILCLIFVIGFIISLFTSSYEQISWIVIVFVGFCIFVLFYIFSAIGINLLYLFYIPIKYIIKIFEIIIKKIKNKNGN